MRVAIKRRSDASATRSMPPGALAANSSQASFETACRSRVVGEKLGFLKRQLVDANCVGCWHKHQTFPTPPEVMIYKGVKRMKQALSAGERPGHDGPAHCRPRGQ